MVQAAAEGVTNLFQYGGVVTVLVLVIVAGLLLWRFMWKGAEGIARSLLDQCEKREERAIVNWEKANERSVKAFEDAITVIEGVKVTLARIETKMDK